MRGDEVRPTALLPVEVKLPEARGWVVASLPRAQLRYRTTADGLWQSTTVDAALPPEALEVTRPGKAPEVVRMTG